MSAAVPSMFLPPRNLGRFRPLVAAISTVGAGSVVSAGLSALASKVIAIAGGPAAIGHLATLQQIRQVGLVVATGNGQTAVIQGGSELQNEERRVFLRTSAVLFAVATSGVAFLFGLGPQVLQMASRLDIHPELLRAMTVPIMLSSGVVFCSALLNVLHALGSVAKIQVAASAAFLIAISGHAGRWSGASSIVWAMSVSAAVSLVACLWWLLEHRQTLRFWAAGEGSWFARWAFRRFCSTSAALLFTGWLGSISLLMVRSHIAAQQGAPALGQFDAAWAISMTQATFLLSSLQAHYLPALCRAYVRREFLGEVRCLVFDVSPVRPQQTGKFIGRIWVEDRDNFIVRFNGTYVQPPPSKAPSSERYFHFDSWRVQTGGSTWAPALIYVEEEGEPAGISNSAGKGKNVTDEARSGRLRPETAPPAVRFKAQTRIWDYAATPASRLDELTSILVDSPSQIKDDATAKDLSPLESQRSWERQAEENILDRLEKGGMIAPKSPVDQVLDTVIGNLIFSANLNIDAHCRVLLTTPMETFSVGHTIVISRGMIDVLPDEASLALVLATELSHIALGHRTPTQFAFYNRTMLSDAELLQTLRFQRPPEEMSAAGLKTIDIIKVSPYAKTGNAGLFLKALAGRSQALPRLLQANLGNQIADAAALARLQAFTDAAPALEEEKLEQIAALPLGSRIKVNPWTNRIELVKAKPLALLSPREKMPFEVTPVVLYLTRPEISPKPELSAKPEPVAESR